MYYFIFIDILIFAFTEKKWDKRIKIILSFWRKEVIEIFKEEKNKYKYSLRGGRKMLYKKRVKALSVVEFFRLKRVIFG